MSDLPSILTSDDELSASLKQFHEEAENLQDFFLSMQDALCNDPQADFTTPTPHPHYTRSALSFITRQELEIWKRAALEELGLGYIPQVLAEFKGGE
jgi:hypothetical protein